MKIIINKDFFKSAILLGMTPLLISSSNVSSNNAPVRAQSTIVKSSDSITKTLPLIPLLFIKNVPDYYREQLINAGYREDDLLASIEELTLDFDGSAPLYWLSSCTNIQNLTLNIHAPLTSQNLTLPRPLENLKKLSISCIDRKMSSNYDDWRAVYEQSSKGTFYKHYSTYSNKTKGIFYNDIVNEVALTGDMEYLVEMCPNVTTLFINGFSYNSEIDLSWIAKMQRLRNLSLLSYMDGDSDFNRDLPSVLNALPELKNLNIYTSSIFLNDKDMTFISDTLTPLPATSITYRSYKEDGFAYVKDNGKVTFTPSTRNEVDFKDFPPVDEIDYSKPGIYSALIYLDSATIAQMENLPVNLGKNYTLADLKAMDAKLNDVIDSLGLTPEMSDSAKFDAILEYICKNHSYADIDKLDSATIRGRFYKEGPLCGAMTRKSIICGNYASLLCALLHRAGIESYYIASPLHAWTLVNIDGEYFYTDPTNLDASYEYNKRKGLSSHDAIRELHTDEFYKMDPVTLEKDSSPSSEYFAYYQSTYPYWLDIYDEIVDKTVEEAKTIRLQSS